MRLPHAERLRELPLELARTDAGGDLQVECRSDERGTVVLVENRAGGQQRCHPRYERRVALLLPVVLADQLQDVSLRLAHQPHLLLAHGGGRRGSAFGFQGAARDSRTSRSAAEVAAVRLGGCGTGAGAGLDAPETDG